MRMLQRRTDQPGVELAHPHWRNEETYKDQRGVQVFVIILDKLSVVFLRFLVVHRVELGPVILQGRRRDPFLTAQGFRGASEL